MKDKADNINGIPYIYCSIAIRVTGFPDWNRRRAVFKDPTNQVNRIADINSTIKIGVAIGDDLTAEMI